MAIDEAARLGLPPIGPKTINAAYMAHVSAIFAFAVDEDWALKNPFVKLTASDPVDPEDKRDPFTDTQLKQLFQSEPWDRRCPDSSEDAGRFWVPVIGLFMGARLAEISGLRITDVLDLEGQPALMIKKVAGGRGIKTKQSRRPLPIHSQLIRMGFLAYVEHRRRTADASDLLFPEGEPNSRNQYGVKIGKWFGRLVAKRKLEGTMVSFHSLRHNWEDRLKVAGIYGVPVGQALGGRKQTGSEGVYGSGSWPINVLSAAMEKVGYPKLDLSHLEVAGKEAE